MAPAAVIEAYRVQQALAAGKAATVVQTAFASFVDPYNLDRSFPAYLTAAGMVIEGLQAEAAALGGGFYLAHREALNVFEDVPAVVPAAARPGAVATSLFVTGPVAMKRSVGKGATLEQAFAVAQALTGGAAYRHVANAGRLTIANTARRDKRARGYARVTDGHPCSFCAMLAGRGAVYKEATALYTEAGNRYHDKCGCFAVPVYSPDDPRPGSGRDFRELWESLPPGEQNAAGFRRLYTATYPKPV